MAVWLVVGGSVLAAQSADELLQELMAGDPDPEPELAWQAETPQPPQPPQPPQAAPEARGFAFAGKTGGSYLGVGIAEIDSNRAKELKLKEEHGVELTRIEPDSPAERAGLQKGDVVLEYNGQRVEGMEQFQRMVRETPPKRTVKLLISRNGATQTATATVEKRKQKEWAVLAPEFRRDMDKLQEELGQLQFRMPDMPQPFMAWRTTMLGIEAESLTPQLAEFFGVKEGVLVRTVIRDTPAEKAGLKAGDVITKVDGEVVKTPGDVSSKLKSRAGKSVPITVVRNRGEVVLSVVLEDKSTAPPPREFGPRRVRAPRQEYIPRARTAAVTPFL
jgi:serine protease Do